MKTVTRSGLLGIAALLAAGGAPAAPSPQVPLAGKAIAQFVQPLPLLDVSPGGTMATVLGNGPLTVTMCEFDAKVLPPGTLAPGVQPLTRVWGYVVGNTCPAAPQDTYIGPVILNARGVPTDVTWVNNLGTTATTGVLAYKYSTDQTLHWADPLNAEANDCSHMAMFPAFGSPCSRNYGEGVPSGAPIPAVVHLHGGEVPAELDGGPDAWFTSDGAYRGHAYYSFPGAPANGAIYKYPNVQEAAPIWFHDHTLGATRLNVYAGLAGAYLISDPGLALPPGLAPYGLDNAGALLPTVPVVIQDRMFDTNGQLFFQADSAGGLLWAPNPEHPYWSPEFVGDAIVVNGKAWPYLNVQARRYRFLFLNGSNARTYEMSLQNQATGANGPPMWVIATDGGYLDAPVKLDPALGQRLLMQPGERYEVIIDFAGFGGTNIIVRNTARTPFPKGAPPQGSTLGRIMQFRVAAGTVGDLTYNPAAGVPLRTGAQAIQRLVNPATGALAVAAQRTRLLTLNEVMAMPMTAVDPVTGLLTAYPGGPLEILVNNTKWSGERLMGVDAAGMYVKQPIPGFVPDGFGFNYLSELPKEGETEVWEIVNLTADAHPIHLHLAQFQILNRQNYNVNKYTKAYAASFPGGGWDVTMGMPCAPGAYCPGYGPPLAYDPAANPLSGGKLGGNPNIAPYLQGVVRPPLPSEAGWKDTVIALPGEVTRIAVRYAPTDFPAAAAPALLSYPFDPSGGGQYNYVWHCHIIDHEDNEMMRPTEVVPNPAALRALVRGIDY
jgi:FtsP/CotA-like multicopper oxidase with cupredoxin domain